MNWGRTLTASLMISGMAGAPAFAKDKLVDATDDKRIVEILNDMGFEASARDSDDGFRIIEFEVAGGQATMILNNCVNDRSCGVVTLSAGYDLENGIDPAKLTEWNGDKLFATAYADEEADPFIDMTINLKFGVSEKNFRDTIDWWRVIKTEFESHIDF